VKRHRRQATGEREREREENRRVAYLAEERNRGSILESIAIGGDGKWSFAPTPGGLGKAKWLVFVLLGRRVGFGF
jgi:hypothetical protein